MASKKDEYEFTTVKRMKDAEKLLRKGWELVDSSGKESWFSGSNYKAIMRRPNPKFKPRA